MSRLVAFFILCGFSHILHAKTMHGDSFNSIYALIDGPGVSVSCVDGDTTVELRIKTTSKIDLDIPIRTFAFSVSEMMGDARYYITGTANLTDSTSAPKPNLSFHLNVSTTTRKPFLSFFYKDNVFRAKYFGMLYNFYAPFCSYTAIRAE